MIIPLDRVVFGQYVRKWCLKPYPDHPEGCPWYGKRDSCPPQAPMFDEIAEPPFYLIIQEFDLDAHAKRMRERHPEWTDEMCRDRLHWKDQLDRKTKEEAQQFYRNELPFSDGLVLERPEANGVDLFATCKAHSINWSFQNTEKNPRKTVRRMVIVARRKKQPNGTT